MRFDAAEPGTAEAAWRASGFRDGLPQLDAGPLRRLVVVAAHPDDETLMAGGLIAHASAHDRPVLVVLASSGEASHPESPSRSPQALAVEREAEVTAAVHLLAPDARLVMLRLPDGELSDHEDDLADLLTTELTAGDTVVSTWDGDGHPDHAAVARAAAAAAGSCDAIHLQAPIWFWHWGDPDHAHIPGAVRFDLDGEALTAKGAALALHRTQIEPLSPAPGDEVLLHAGMLEHFLVPSEVLITTSGAQPVDFDAMYSTDDDPWGFGDRWYEQRKRALLMAALPRPRFRSVLEIGSSSGVTTVELADRADALIATDVAMRAVEQARERLVDRPWAVVEHRRLPEDWSEAWGTAHFDLIVLSEVGFYLPGDELDALVVRCRAALGPGGVLVACHWRPHVLGLDRGGDEVHRVIRDRIDARRLVEHLEDDFVLEVFQVPPAPSVAEATGLR